MLQAKLASEHPYPLDPGETLAAGSEPAAVGGSAEVFHGELRGREVAIKLGHGDPAPLFAEATVLALATSPRTPRLRGCGWARAEGDRWVVTRDSGGARPFLVLDWLEDVRGRSTGPDAALTIARDIGEALADAHAVGVAHGDVKRDNVVVDGAGRATLLDWGLACSVFQSEPRGATPRYLALRDKDLGDARARDALAFGVLLVGTCEPSVELASDPIAEARRARLPQPLDAICSALLAENPTARPSLRWVREMARDAATPPDDAESLLGRVRQVRAGYLRARRGELRGPVPEGAAPWLQAAVVWAQETARLQPGQRPHDTFATRKLQLLDRDEIARWLVSIVGPHAASWPVGRLADAGEARIAEALTRLATALDPNAWTFVDVERSVLGSEADAETGVEPTTAAEAVARLSVELSEAPARPRAIHAVERDPEAPPTLVMQAADALRAAGELGRARSLTQRTCFFSAPGSGGVAADIARRAGDVEGARAEAARAIDHDVDKKARAVLGRLAFDSGDSSAALAFVADEPGAACAEVAALAHSARGDVAAALAALARGDAYARTSEDRARLSGTRGYILAGVDSAEALRAFRSATDHAVRAGLVVEEATYRTGDAAAAMDEGYLSEGLASAARAALLWESLGRPALSARALLAQAAAYAIVGALPEAARAAQEAIELAKEAKDHRAVAYAWLAIADSERQGSSEGAVAAEAAWAALELTQPSLDDRLHVMSRRLDHTPHGLTAEVIGELDRAADVSKVGAAALLGWWGSRARQLLRDMAADSTARPGHAQRSDVVLASIVGLASARAPLGARGPALYAGIRLARATGRSDVAERLRAPTRDAARTLLTRAGPELGARAAQVDWVMANLTSDDGPMDAEQFHDLEHLVRALGTGERLGPLLRRVLDALVLWTGVERGLLLLRAPDGRLVARAARNFARDDLRGEQAALSQTLARRALEALEPVVAVDAAGELPDVHRSVHALRLRSVLAVPLIARGEPLGVAYLDDRVRRGAFGPRELAWARTIAALASSMIADARDQVLLRRAVRTARRQSEKLAESLADREAKLSAAVKTIERTTTVRRRHAEITGESEPMVALLRTLDRVAASDVPVLVVGESGSGKELIARAIHTSGARAARPFVSENCGAIPEGLLESALFGHVRGAFTGADRPRVGLFEAADGGTLFLDEVGEMSLGMQTKLLRVLEDGMVRPLGTERPRRVDVRIITATHRDLDALVRERRFREDLFYRLNIISLRVPPLRERASDIPLLVKRLVDKHAGDRQVTVSRAAMARLSSFGWPGNVRQLENEIRRALVLADDVIDRTHLSPEIDCGVNGAVAEAGLNVRRRVDLLETTLVRDALERTRGNQTQAAKLLGLSRFGLQKMMKRLEISVS